MTENQLDNEGMPREIFAGMNKYGETFWARHTIEALPVSAYAKGMMPTRYVLAPSQDDLVKRLEGLKKPVMGGGCDFGQPSIALAYANGPAMIHNAAIDACISEVKK